MWHCNEKSICQGVGWRRTLDDMQGEVQLTQCTKTRRPSLAGLGDITLWKKNNFRFSLFFFLPVRRIIDWWKLLDRE
jgi:hypothetical protein